MILAGDVLDGALLLVLLYQQYAEMVSFKVLNNVMMEIFKKEMDVVQLVNLKKDFRVPELFARQPVETEFKLPMSNVTMGTLKTLMVALIFASKSMAVYVLENLQLAILIVGTLKLDRMKIVMELKDALTLAKL